MGVRARPRSLPVGAALEHVEARQDGTAVVRYVGSHRRFVGELILDCNGFVLTYPDLAERVPGEDRA